MADDDLGTAAADAQADQGAETTAAAADTTAAAAGATDQSAQSAKPAAESFINPADLPEEIKPHWKRMHRAYTQALEKFNARKTDHELLDNFRSNESFALELLRAEASRRGLTLAPVNGTTKPAAPSTAASAPTDVPAHVVEAVRQRLAPELQWMAESHAAAAWEASRLAMQPIVQKDQAREKASREAEWTTLAAKLTESAPGWEAHEDDMNALFDWLKSPALTHPQFGDKLTLLYNVVTGGSVAKRDAIRAMGDAARNASRTGQAGRPMISNVSDRVRQARTPQEAMKIAAEEAERELRERGVALPN